MRTGHAHERGQTAIFMTMSIVVVLGMVGLVVDIGWAYWRKEACKAAAQSAVMAGIKIAKNAANYNCGSGVTCQSDTACPSTLTDNANAIQVACMYAQQNGFTNSGKQTMTIAAGKTSPPVSGISPSYWMSATASETVPQWFGVVLGLPANTVRARATSAIFTSSNGGCVFVTDPTASGALNMTGNSSLTSGCGVYVNSNSGSAVILTNNATITTTGGAKTYIDGGWNNRGTITPAPILGASPASDPFTTMPAPAAGACQPAVNLTSHDARSITAGTYCSQITLTGQSHLTLGPGTYVLKGGIDMTGGTALDATGGVTLYLQSGVFNLTGGASVHLSAPTSGTYKGILLWQDKNDTSLSSVTGGTAQIMNGVLYFPGATLNYTGGSSAVAQDTTILAKLLNMVGNSYIQAAADTMYSGLTTQMAFVE